MSRVFSADSDEQVEHEIIVEGARLVLEKLDEEQRI